MAKSKANPAPKSNGRLSRRAAATKVVVEFQGKSTLAELTAAADALVVAAGGNRTSGNKRGSSGGRWRAPRPSGWSSCTSRWT